MSAIPEIIPSTDLTPEWKRIEILAQCLLESRAEKKPTELLINQLKGLQNQVEFLRKEQLNWRNFTVEKLPDIALDILACVYAPALKPNVALQFQDLQQTNTAYPSIAFIHRLLALTDEEYVELQILLSQKGVLRSLVLIEGDGPLMQIKPHPSVMSFFSVSSKQQIIIPGAVKITIEAEWDDLILQPAQKKILQEYLLWIKYSKKVIKEWGGKSAGGPIALFTGPSGTGKTFAASVIANKLGWPLYRVDLGALISKYIGETEKNLNALFDAAENQKILLQFDEVDALMGKRGDIKDARDRYANMEVSHLLSRIEQYQGPCILTTNLSKQIDQAFQRRFHFVMTFPRPGLQERIILWKKLLPINAPLSKEIDFELIAESASFTGGEIRNAAMHAAILAVSASKKIDLQDISTGVWRVLQKSDGKTRQSQLRKLAEYLPDDVLADDSL